MARRKRYGITRSGMRKLRFMKVRRPIGGFPNSKTVALRYVTDFTLNPGTAPSTATQVFRINNLHDPDYTGVGHQPMFWDNYKAIYARYRVNKATITFVAMDTHAVNVFATSQVGGTTSSETQYYAYNERATRMFILRDDEVNDFTSGKGIDTLIEEGNTNFKWRYAPQNTSAYMPKLRMTAYPKTLLKCPYNDASLTADTTGGPAKECYFICGVDSFPNSNSDVMNFQAIITYSVTFSDLIKDQPVN